MNKNARLLLIVGLLQVIWGFVPGASKFVIDEIPVELYISLRWSISGAVFAIYLFLSDGWRGIGRKDLLQVGALGILGYGLASFGTLYGLKLGGVTNFAFMSAIGPLMTSAMSVLVLRERPSRLFYFALPLSIAGLSILAFGKYEISSISIAGSSVVLILGASLLEALVFVYSKKTRGTLTSVQYLAVAQLSAALFMWILQISFFHQIRELAHLSMTGLGAAVFVSVVACVLCYAVLYWLLNHIDGHRLALFDGFHTLSAALFGVLIFQEPLRPLMALGGLFILAGLVIGNWPREANRPG